MTLRDLLLQALPQPELLSPAGLAQVVEGKAVQDFTAVLLVGTGDASPAELDVGHF